MHLLVTVGMQQHPVVQVVTAAIDAPLNMMIVPACFLGDELTADRTEPLLPSPLMPPGSVHQVGKGSFGLPLFEVHLHSWVIGIGVASHLDMALDGHLGRLKEPDGDL